MNHHSSPPDDSWESDAVWKLLDEASPKSASINFADQVVRAAKIDEPAPAWWQRLLSPAPLAGIGFATAVLAISMVSLFHFSTTSSSQLATLNSPEAAEIQNIAETEALIAAVDQLDDYSDTELVRLIGF